MPNEPPSRRQPSLPANASLPSWRRESGASGPTSSRPRDVASPGVEWICGLLHAPRRAHADARTQGELDTLLFLAPDGEVLSCDTVRSDYAFAHAFALFVRATTTPRTGAPHMPSRIRVASSELATVLRIALGDRVEIVCAPTPELDALAAAARAYFEEIDEECTLRTLRAPDVTVSAIASFFRAAAQLWHAAPWARPPSEGSVLKLTIASLGVRDAALAVLGRSDDVGDACGWCVFDSASDCERFAAGAELLDHGLRVDVPRHVVLTYGRGADLAAVLRKEIARHRWDVAAANAYPMLFSVDEDLVAHLPSPLELARAEATSRALARHVSEDFESSRLWRPRDAVDHAISTFTSVGPVEVRLGPLRLEEPPCRNRTILH